MLPAHECSYYCQGTVHAVLSLLPLGATLTDAESCGRAWWGAAFLSARSCPEVDVDVWRAKEGWNFPPNGVHRMPWLTFIESTLDTLTFAEKIRRAMDWTHAWRARQQSAILGAEQPVGSPRGQKESTYGTRSMSR
jgi:hypothetical protein